MRVTPTMLIAIGLFGCDSSNDASVDPTADIDGDGYTGSVDCDDADASTHPGAVELCDGIDNNCNSIVDDDPANGELFFIDFDGDGFGHTDLTSRFCGGPAKGYVTNSSDCDDLSADAFPGGTEICDGIDNNCDGAIDNNAPDTSMFYYDGDGDGFGDDAVTIRACVAPESYADVAGDCTDTDALVHPQSVWYPDADNDGFGLDAQPIVGCQGPRLHVLNNFDCNDVDPFINPDAEEICNNIDDNCDGELPPSDADFDGDGQPLCAGDCADDEPTTFSGAEEICDDGLDNDCNSVVDNNCPTDVNDADVIFTGEKSYDYMFYGLDADGDVNGDGYNDVVTGAYLADPAGVSNGGKTYIFYGPFSSGESFAAADASVIINGTSTSSYSGYEVAIGGDINGDGYGDLISSAYYTRDFGYTGGGAAYVFYGPLTNSELSTDDADAAIYGTNSFAYTGQYYLDMKDLNNDGLDEAIVGVYRHSARTSSGGIIAAFEEPSGDVAITSADISFNGNSFLDYVGYDGVAEDFDGDGFTDFMWSAPYYFYKDEAFVTYGPISSGDEFLANSSGYDVNFTGSRSGVGEQLGGGDVNGDGYIDYVVSGGYYTAEGLTYAGAITVHFGPISAGSSIDITEEYDFRVMETVRYNYLGRAFTTELEVEDINADGIDDLFYTSSYNDTISSQNGAGFLVYGPVTGEMDTDTYDKGFFNLSGRFAYTGRSNAVGDLDDDGMLDILIADNGSAYAGASYVFFNESL
ncbi:MAG: MopE-related protein [Myxococcota bacterium]